VRLPPASHSPQESHTRLHLLTPEAPCSLSTPPRVTLSSLQVDRLLPLYLEVWCARMVPRVVDNNDAAGGVFHSYSGHFGIFRYRAWVDLWLAQTRVWGHLCCAVALVSADAANTSSIAIKVLESSACTRLH
jgi:hypothetical protein